MTTSETLYAAADVIERDGWTKGNAGTIVGDGPKCAIGALGKAMGAKTLPVPPFDTSIYHNALIVDSVAGRALCDYLGDKPASQLRHLAVE